MGNSRYDFAEAQTYRSVNKVTATASREQVFKQRAIAEKLDPSKIVLRESCDSEANPNSTPIILALDVTGSMGFIAESIAKTELDEVIRQIYETQPVPDPHLMFMGVGDVHARDRAPLQVSQFEAGATPLLEQLQLLYLESGGGGNGYESYDLPWYFAANFTKTDSFDKRQQRGFLFGIGDEPPPEMTLSEQNLKSIFGQNSEVSAAGTVKECLAKAQEKFQVFQIIAEEGNHFQYRGTRVTKEWNKLLGPNVLYMQNHKDLPLIIHATLTIANGADIYEVIGASNKPHVLRHAFKNSLPQG